ncbi:hypothetical protein EJ08DRAFT_702451 [Tothia fuscella]|uniref:DUF7730 domain-containing protein n=1 Tax=Tothia fuscella TaxID=1048955 RepID=A0A9P4NG92_9PEZI|nr:hypothetical protein EJ08DRAFT_702451 [Tothia fuscella]
MASKHDRPADDGDNESAQEQSVAKRQKRQPRLLFNANKASAALKAITKSNDECSPLLKLPKEIRDVIYGYVLTDRMVHIGYDDKESYDDKKLFHSLCRCKQSEEEVHRIFGESEDQYSAPISFYRHKSCIFSPFEHRDGNFKPRYIQIESRFAFDLLWSFSYQRRLEIPDTSSEDLLPTDTLTTGLLRTCRRVYYEAQPLVYANTFSFRNADTFKQFIDSLMPAQIRMIKSIHLETQLSRRWCTAAWRYALRTGTMKSLSSLRHLQVDVELSWGQHHGHLEAKNDFLSGDMSNSRYIPSLTEFSRCALTTVHVIVSDEEAVKRWTTGSVDQWRWTLEEKRGLAAHFEAAMLEEWSEDRNDEVLAKKHKHAIASKESRLKFWRTRHRETEGQDVYAKARIVQLEEEIRKSEEWHAKRKAGRKVKCAVAEDGGD